MVASTWVIGTILALTDPGPSGSLLGDVVIVRLIKVLRLARIARVARLLRAVPEIMILVKGVVIAARSVFFTLLLLVLVMYVFAVAFCQLLEGTELGEEYFSSMGNAMATLLL